MAGNLRHIIRAHRVIREAADLLDNLAQSISDCEQIDGEWPFGSEEAKEHHDQARKTAISLRDLLVPKGEVGHAA